ncbi:MAG TPA: AAA family ATPase [Candidatus Mediterraneibacter caccogallinarum]|nr:AAA family ATPase [Candidatus Mediterraneibacter caccogallinarum]
MAENSRYMDGTLFLQDVTEKIRQRLDDIKQSLDEGQKEIESMHEYYWENYTEMDQYGYEDYDNQQALLSQVNANQDKLVLKHRFERMADAPFFGRVDFIFDGEEEAEPFYIGIGNFAEKAGMTPLIYDWRAPVSGLFYDYDKGPASYEAPAGTIRGEISSKWQYKIRGGKMIYAFESDTKIDDEILKQELGNNGDVKLKNIVRTIQKEQNAIIRNTKDKILVIQGAAGSGKTSIALHRIAYLLYHDRKNLKSSNVLVLSPNSVFGDYISHILPELGEENIREMSFDLFAYRELKDTAADCEDRYDHLERIMKFPDDQEKERFRMKQSESFVGLIEGFLATLEDRLVDFRPISFRGSQLTEEELIRMFYFKFQETPLLARMDAVMDYFVDAYETLKGRDISDEDREMLREKFDSMYVTKDIYTIYNWLLEDYGYDMLPDVPYERRKVQYEDVFPMLYLKYRLLGHGAQKNIKHLVIDEMQDYSFLQYVLLKQIFQCRMTILGDYAQTLDTKQHDVLKFLPKIFGKEIRQVILRKSYRNTYEIARYAGEISGIRDLELLERHGKEVEERRFSSEDEMLEAVRENLRLGSEGYETAAVITMTEEEAYDIYRLLTNRGIDAAYVDRDSSAFKRGLTVTTFYLAKGLEFDQVFTIKGTEGNPLEKQAQYISATRALQELYVYQCEN